MGCQSILTDLWVCLIQLRHNTLGRQGHNSSSDIPSLGRRHSPSLPLDAHTAGPGPSLSTSHTAGPGPSLYELTPLSVLSRPPPSTFPLFSFTPIYTPSLYFTPPYLSKLLNRRCLSLTTSTLCRSTRLGVKFTPLQTTRSV